MIIYLMIVITILTFIAWFFINNLQLRWICGLITMGLLLLCSIALSANLYSHWGMTKDTKVTVSTDIYSARTSESPANILLYQNLGTKTNNAVLIFRDKRNEEQAKPHFVPEKKDIRDSSKKRAVYRLTKGQKAKITIKRTEWRYRSNTAKWFFDFADNDHQLISQRTTVTLPENSWVVMTPAQAKKLATLQKQLSTAEKNEQEQMMRQAIQEKVRVYQQNNPQASAQEIASYSQRLTAELSVKALNQTLQKLK